MKLDPLVKPRSVAIVGATDRGGPGRAVIESLGAIGFTGPIYPVNPKYPTVLNIKCYPSLTELPEAPDIVVFSIRNPLIPEQMRLAVRRGARAAVIYDFGFAELGGDGAKLQDEIAAMAREAGMPVCGPNCMGILNPQARVTTYKQNVRDPAAIVGNVGIVSQSGSVCIALLSDLRRFGVSLSVSAGNEAVTRTVDYLDYLIDDPNTKVIATFTETVREPERYVAALDRAADAGKPVVVIKVGRTERTQRAITSHTGGLAGSSRVFSELLRAHRAIEVNDLDEMTEVLGGVPGQALAARPRHFGGDRLGRIVGTDPRQCHRGRPRSAAALGRGARGSGARHRPHHRRRQSVRCLGQRQLRGQYSACHVGRGQKRPDRFHSLLRRRVQRSDHRSAQPRVRECRHAHQGGEPRARSLIIS